MIERIRTGPHVAKVSQPEREEYLPKAKNAVVQEQSASADEQPAAVVDIGGARPQSVGYNAQGAKYADEIKRLQEDTRRATQSLLDIVMRLIAHQGKNMEDLLCAEDVLFVDTEARDEAVQLVSEEGEWGVEAVSQRIVDFAKAISGGDKSKLAELKAAIDQGFAQAADALGGDLPDICNDTYDAIMRKLDEWAVE